MLTFLIMLEETFAHWKISELATKPRLFLTRPSSSRYYCSLRGPVHLLHLSGDICGARLHTMRPQLLQGLSTGLLEPQQEVPVPHVQEELL